MKTKKFIPSAAMQNRLAKQREQTMKFLGTQKYNEIVTNYFPLIRSTMLAKNCCAIAAACQLLLENKTTDLLEQNLVACAGYDLALAA